MQQPDQSEMAALHQSTEVVNPFPIPPERYALFTTKNIELLSQLRERTGTKAHEDLPPEKSQADILSDCEAQDLPDWSLITLEKPRLDWVIEGGAYLCYSNGWEIIDGQPILHERGKLSSFLADPIEDQRPHLIKLLLTLLRSYYVILGRATEYPLVDQQAETLHSAELTYVTETAMNLMEAVNDFRPLQARDNLEQMLRKQLKDRQEETQAINSKCDDLEKKLENLRELARQAGEKTSNYSGRESPLLVLDSKEGEATKDPLVDWIAQVE